MPSFFGGSVHHLLSYRIACRSSHHQFACIAHRTLTNTLTPPHLTSWVSCWRVASLLLLRNSYSRIFDFVCLHFVCLWMLCVRPPCPHDFPFCFFISFSSEGPRFFFFFFCLSERHHLIHFAIIFIKSYDKIRNELMRYYVYFFLLVLSSQHIM